MDVKRHTVYMKSFRSIEIQLGLKERQVQAIRNFLFHASEAHIAYNIVLTFSPRAILLILICREQIVIHTIPIFRFLFFLNFVTPFPFESMT